MSQQNAQNAAKKPQLPLVEPSAPKDDLRVTMADVERLTAECEEKERALTEVRWTLEEAHAEVARLKAQSAEDATKMTDAMDAIATLSDARNDLERRLRDAERNAGPLTREATIGDLASALRRGSIFCLRLIPQGARMAVQCYPSPLPGVSDIPTIAVNGESVEDALTCLVSAVRPN